MTTAGVSPATIVVGTAVLPAVTQRDWVAPDAPHTGRTVGPAIHFEPWQ
jgi:hypothetical protein